MWQTVMSELFDNISFSIHNLNGFQLFIQSIMQGATLRTQRKISQISQIQK